MDSNEVILLQESYNKKKCKRRLLKVQYNNDRPDVVFNNSLVVLEQ